MKAIFRTAVLAISLGLSGTAFAQSKAPASNPVGRGDNVFFYAPMNQPAIEMTGVTRIEDGRAILADHVH